MVAARRGFVPDPVEVAPPPPPEEPKKKRGLLGNVGQFLVGAGKGAAHTLNTVSGLGQSALSAITPGEQQIASLPKNVVTPEGTAQKIGFGAEQVGEFFIPGTVASKAGKAIETAGLAGKALKGAKLGLEGAGIAATTLAQGGDAKDAATNVVYAGGFGLAGKAVGKIADKIAPRIINSLIKPLSKDFEFGKNPGLGVVREKITASSFDDLIGKLNLKRAEVGTEIGKTLSHPEIARQTIDLAKALAPIDEALA